MTGYGGWTSSKKNVERLRAAGFGMVVTPKHPKEPTLRYMVDNGAYELWTKGRPFDGKSFLAMLDKISGWKRRPDFACCPDKVAGGYASLDFSLSWVDRLPTDYPWYLAVQDGMTPCGVLQALQRFAGIFVGGTSVWKLNSLPAWAELGRQEKKAVHVGRVNSLARAFYAAKVCRADSFDGSSWQRDYQARPDKNPKRVVSCTQEPLDLFGLGGGR